MRRSLLVLSLAATAVLGSALPAAAASGVLPPDGPSDPRAAARHADDARVLAADSARARFRPPTPGSCSSASPACRREVPHDYQDHFAWCVPASVKAVLHGAASQRSLAEQMGTTSKGTRMRRAPAVMNAFTSHEYVFTLGSASYGSARDLLDVVKVGVGNRKAAMVLGVEGGALKYWSPGASGRHAIVGDGWSGSRVLVWDPLDDPVNRKHRGDHAVASQIMFEAALLNQRQLVW